MTERVEVALSWGDEPDRETAEPIHTPRERDSDPRLVELISLLERIDWRHVDGVSTATAARFADLCRRADR